MRKLTNNTWYTALLSNGITYLQATTVTSKGSLNSFASCSRIPRWNSKDWNCQLQLSKVLCYNIQWSVTNQPHHLIAVFSQYHIKDHHHNWPCHDRIRQTILLFIVKYYHNVFAVISDQMRWYLQWAYPLGTRYKQSQYQYYG